MILVEECRVALDDPVATYLPELGAVRVLRDPGGPVRRHGRPRAADHAARPADLHLRVRPGHPADDGRGADRHGGARPAPRRARPARSERAARTRRVDRAARLPTAHVPTRRALAVRGERQRARRARRPGRRPAVRALPVRAAVRAAAEWATPGSACPPARWVGSHPCGDSTTPARLRSQTRWTGCGAHRRRSPTARPGWCRPWSTTPRSAR